MHEYGVRDVEKLLNLPRSTIRALISAGFVAPTRGPRKALRFSFQDLIVLRTAQALADAKVPAKRITRSLKALRRQLPETMPLSGLSIGAVGDRVVVRDSAGQRQVESGQYLLAFEGDPEAGSLSVIEHQHRAPAADEDEEDWFDKAVALEQVNPEAALHAYRRAIAADPARPDARINVGRLLHETGDLAQAERVYREALDTCGASPVLLFNLGVLLEDLEREAEAMDAYYAALRGDSRLADCHYNLALLCEKLGKAKDAIRHMSQYRRLAGTQAE
jgi:tetratricopeptide (TPR) repeat protein